MMVKMDAFKSVAILLFLLQGRRRRNHFSCLLLDGHSHTHVSLFYVFVFVYCICKYVFVYEHTLPHTCKFIFLVSYVLASLEVFFRSVSQSFQFLMGNPTHMLKFAFCFLLQNNHHHKKNIYRASSMFS